MVKEVKTLLDHKSPPEDSVDRWSVHLHNFLERQQSIYFLSLVPKEQSRAHTRVRATVLFL